MTASASSWLDTATVGVPQPEDELRLGAALLGRLAEPGDRFDGILWDAKTEGVHSPEAYLRVGVALLGGQAVPG